ncbi:MAG: FISUMP domain-containing protein [Bacteroidota bacterium]
MRTHIQYLVLILLVASLLISCQPDEDIAIPIMEITATVNPVSAFGAKDGSIDVSVSGGTAPYIYTWNTGEKAEDLTGIAAGEYMLRVLDSNSGVVERTFVLAQPQATPLDLSFQTTDVNNFGGNDGSVSVEVRGGTAPYTYLWSNGETTPQIENLNSQQYKVTVTDGGDPVIVTIDSIFIGQPDFMCGRDSITDVNGNKYATIQLGGQCWTASNLRTQNQPKNPELTVDGVLCDGLNCNNTLGAHYTWMAATLEQEADENGNIQGVCPCEWHLPTVAEWTALNTYLSGNGNGGDGMNVPNKLRGANSSSGFDVLYAGNWGYPLFDGELAAFWTATALNERQATYRMVNTFPLLAQGNAEKTLGLSVRCVKD